MQLPNNAIRKGVRRPDRAIKHLKSRMTSSLEFYISKMIGWHPFQKKWDILVILDGCRYDLAKESKATQQFGQTHRIFSVGSGSRSWIERTFTDANDEQLGSTAYVTSNPFANEAPEELGYVDNLFDTHFDGDLGTIPPRAVTDRSIKLIRAGVADRYIIHYMQPHLPPVFDGDEADGFEHDIIPTHKGGGETNYWTQIKNGERSGEMVTRAYKKNLPPVAAEVELLLNNIDADTVKITADHGNFLGERGRWGHGYRSLHPALRMVPLYKTSGTDKQTYDPPEYNRDDNSTTRMERLQALGYR